MISIVAKTRPLKVKGPFKNLRQGKTLYTVHSLGAGSFLEELVVQDTPKVRTTIREFHGMCEISDYEHVLVEYPDFKGTVHDVSLMDLNIIPNHWNKHRAFYSKKKAQAYLNLCLQGTIAYKEFLIDEDEWDLYEDDDAWNPNFEDDLGDEL